VPVRIYNSFSQKKEEINLKEKIGIYVCGITPDGRTHLGHAFLFVTYDSLIRYLRFLSAQVTYVQNVTDIDDDILIRSKAAGFTWRQLGKIQTKNYLKLMDNLNVIRPDFYPNATENIKQMIKIIQKLVARDLAYIKNGSVYFSVSRDKNFGKLSKYDYPAMLEIANERGNFPQDPNKEDPLDFVLWQAQKPGEPSWNSPWGKGRPGWHIECSAMSMRFLGPTVTIHGGGSDLIFPHHEAEITQSENFTGKKFVKTWMHVTMVYCDGKKMSKSLGNMVFVSDLLKKYSANTIRIFLLSRHYRIPWNYEEKGLETAQKIAAKLSEALGKGLTLTTVSQKQRSGLSKSQSPTRQDDNQDLNRAKRFLPDFFKALDDDFNTPRAIMVLRKAAKENISEEKFKAIYTASKILGLNLL